MSVQELQADNEPLRDEFAAAVLKGLSAPQKSIPCRFLYDARGSELFEQITRLDEYYPTRTEIGLLKAHGPEIAELAGEGCAVVEFGSGSSRKTHVLLDHLNEPSAYVPIEIDAEALGEAAVRIANDFPGLPLHPVHADFGQDIDLPDAIGEATRFGFFPGSTIGNMEPRDAVRFLARAGELLGPDSDMLIGADLRKDLDILLPAYDDAKGITAAFVLNILERINRELEGDLDIDRFEHLSLYNEEKGRIEIYIVSRDAQEIHVVGESFRLAAGERIHTENSHKYTLEQFAAMGRKAGWGAEQCWVDSGELFSLHYLRRLDG